MPELDIYFPPVIIKVYDSRGFGCCKYAGVYIVPTAYVFLEKLITEEEYVSAIYGEDCTSNHQCKKKNSAAVCNYDSNTVFIYLFILKLIYLL